MIIREIKDSQQNNPYKEILFPDQFVSEKTKKKPEYIKKSMDFFGNVALQQYYRHKETFVKNYDLVKGILRAEDFYQDEQVKSFVDTLIKDIDLPSYVKHYSIMNPPLNTLIGEMTKRPDNHRVKAFDDNSKSEELQYKTEIFQQYVIEKVRKQILLGLAQKGEVDVDPEEIQELTLEQVSEYLTDYTSIAERWANHVLEACKVIFRMKEKSEEGFRDLLISSREFYHIYENNSKLGFDIKVVNPKNEWHLTTPDRNYIHKDAYAAGTIEVMEISEILDTFPDLTKEDIDHLKKGLKDYGVLLTRSNYGRNVPGGINSIHYDTYSPLMRQEALMVESQVMTGENPELLNNYLGLQSYTGIFGDKYIVTRAYWKSKKLIKKVTYMDEMGVEQTMLTDENYKEGDIPTEIEVEEGWINCIYEGTKIGPEVYLMKEFKFLDYIPIIGVVHEIKNTEARSLVDLMKPFQVLYNICMNQLYRLLEKEIGVVYKVQLRRIPTPKDGDGQDAIEMWEQEARERGIVFEDDSPENLKAQLSNTTVSQAVDLSRTNEIQTRYNLAIQLKTECWQLVGLSPERLATVQASQTATGTNAALNQSYAQTEPYFTAHEYVMNDVYQAIVDAAQYIESNKDVSSISYITNQGEAAFIEVNGSDLKLRDLHIFATSRPEDQKAFEEMRMLSQAMLQNGASPYEILELYSTNSIRQAKQIFKTIKERQEQMIQQEQELERAKIEQAQAQFEQNLQLQNEVEERRLAEESYQKELDRINKKEVALINALGRNENATADNDNSGVADALEITKMNNDKVAAQNEYSLKLQEAARKEKEMRDKISLEEEKMKLEREKMKNDLKIERLKLRNPVSGEKKKKK